MPARISLKLFSLLKCLLLLLTGAVILISLSNRGYAQEMVNPHGKLLPGLDCSACHRSDTWTPAKKHMNFNHATTSFKLIGKHALLTCQSCHIKLKFDEPKALNTDCASCHVDVHQGKLGTSCADCHNQNSFKLVNGVTIHQRTGFPLTGAHAVISCESCHKTRRNGAFTNLDPTCYSCHEQDYKNAKTVNHVANNFSTDCRSCHNTSGWGSSTFDHALVANGFALLGAHKQLRCVSCHNTPSFTPKFPAKSDQDCYTCHAADFQRAHGGSGFPHTCSECHTVNSWDDANFDHASVANGFALLGAHKKLTCSSCHDPSTFKPIFPATSDQDCYTCHKADYQRAHSGTGFSTTCTNCHNVNTWDGAEFTAHDSQFFPIYSGTHKNTWSTCQTCHTDPSNYKTFSCLNCHEHNKTTTDSHHTDVNGYQYLSTACYSCHPTGRSGD